MLVINAPNPLKSILKIKKISWNKPSVKTTENVTESPQSTSYRIGTAPISISYTEPVIKYSLAHTYTQCYTTWDCNTSTSLDFWNTITSISDLAFTFKSRKSILRFVAICLDWLSRLSCPEDVYSHTWNYPWYLYTCDILLQSISLSLLPPLGILVRCWFLHHTLLSEMLLLWPYQLCYPGVPFNSVLGSWLGLTYQPQ
jgi:hypothetical protein